MWKTIFSATVIPCGQPASLADELGALAGLLARPGGGGGAQGRNLLVLKCGYLLDEDSSPDSERLQSLGDVDSGHSTAHSPIDTGPKSISPTQLQQNGEFKFFVLSINVCSLDVVLILWYIQRYFLTTSIRCTNNETVNIIIIHNIRSSDPKLLVRFHVGTKYNKRLI